MPGRLLSVSIRVGMCEFSCDRDFESCFTTIPEIGAQLLMAAEPNICEGRLIPLTGGSWVVAALDGPKQAAKHLQICPQMTPLHLIITFIGPFFFWR